MRGVRAVVAATLVLSSCGRIVAPSGTSPSTVLVELDGQGNLPTAVLGVGAARYEGVLGTHCWESSGMGFCADAPGLPAPSSFVEIERNTTLSVEGDADSVHGTLGTPRPSSFGTAGKHGFVELDHPVELDLSDGQERLTAPPGRYVLEIFAQWPRGDGDFSFGITITDG